MKLFITKALSIGIMIPQQGWDISPGWDPYPCKACHCCSQTHTRSKKITPGSNLCHVLHIIQRCRVGLINLLSNGKVARRCLIFPKTWLIQAGVKEHVLRTEREREWLGCCGDKFNIFNSCGLSEVKRNYGGTAQCKCFIYAKSNVVFGEVEALKY